MGDKWTPAQAEATARYEAKTYKKYLFRLRMDEDGDIIDSINEALAQGINKRQWLSDLFHYGGKPEGYVSKSDVWKLLRDMGVSDEIIRKVMEL
jgi:hypothetical protein